MGLASTPVKIDRNGGVACLALNMRHLTFTIFRI